MAIYPYHNWHALSRDKVLGILEIDQKGLTESEAIFRLEQYGRNEVPSAGVQSVFSILLGQFKNPFIIILVVAGAISALPPISSKIDAAIIFGAVILNTVIGFLQELKVSNILEELNKIVSYHNTVLRSGVQKTVSAKDIAIGDVIVLRQGDKVPADARIIKASNFKTNEVAFSGESSPVEKKQDDLLEVDIVVADRTNMVFMGTTVEEGFAQVATVATGLQTEFGKIASIVLEKNDETPLQRKLRKLATSLGIFFLAISALLFGAGIIRGEEVFFMFLTAVAVAVAAVPESLPIALSSTLAVGAKRILKKGGLIRKMIGAEALGSTTVITLDKTATITEGKMSVTNISTVAGEDFVEKDFISIVERDRGTPEYVTFELMAMIQNATLENPFESESEWKIHGRSIDKATLLTTRKIGILREELDKICPRLAELPFDSRRRYSASLNHITKNANIPITTDSKTNAISLLGAPEILMSMSSSYYASAGQILSLDKDKKTEIEEKLNDLASKGFKILSVAYKVVDKSKLDLVEEDINNLIFLGLVAFADPIREEVAESIATAQSAGVRVVMITGDHSLTARYVAQSVGILSKGEGSSRIIEGKNLPVQLNNAVLDNDVFARISPQDKLRIVEEFQEQKEGVAMIGDGINDASAIVRADLGVAVGSGTDVAKEAADLILLNDSFTIIVEAIRQGRVILDNIKKALVFLLSNAFAEVIIIAGSIALGLPLALLPAQILWVNIIIDGVPAISLAFEKEESNIMKRGPSKTKNIFTINMKKLVALFSIVTDLAIFVMFIILYKNTGDEVYARTMTFTALGVTSLFYIFSVRSFRVPVWKVNPFSNRVLVLGVLIGIIAYIFSIYVGPFQAILDTVPLGIKDWGLVILLGFFSIAVIEFAKWKYFNKDALILEKSKIK